MAWYNPKTWGENLNKRNIQIPEKVFIEREGGHYEYSE